ncbi:hypothetical protein GALMADRAFT_217484 [Galerina marginata CBS 339.88]|uniref:Uncharacterized protein n=1 Tax=Galerina marginata (strain CBS 339.88) TaxID=685588 RepID=A0A067SCW3_GALM3|nr:hypothetical protein GALMADRAFT_217484 [Galerina marginata CBS 339.88]
MSSVLTLLDLSKVTPDPETGATGAPTLIPILKGLKVQNNEPLTREGSSREGSILQTPSRATGQHQREDRPTAVPETSPSGSDTPPTSRMRSLRSAAQTAPPDALHVSFDQSQSRSGLHRGSRGSQQTMTSATQGGALQPTIGQPRNTIGRATRRRSDQRAEPSVRPVVTTLTPPLPAPVSQQVTPSTQTLRSTRSANISSTLSHPPEYSEPILGAGSCARPSDYREAILTLMFQLEGPILVIFYETHERTMKAAVANGEKMTWTVSRASTALISSYLDIPGSRIGHLHFHRNLARDAMTVWMLEQDGWIERTSFYARPLQNPVRHPSYRGLILSTYGDNSWCPNFVTQATYKKLRIPPSKLSLLTGGVSRVIEAGFGQGRVEASPNLAYRHRNVTLPASRFGGEKGQTVRRSGVLLTRVYGQFKATAYAATRHYTSVVQLPAHIYGNVDSFMATSLTDNQRSRSRAARGL